jgi:predicted GNAT family N-acyltransferase
MGNFIFTLCDKKERLKVYKLWYDVYFREMNRNSEYANHADELILDDLEPNSDIILLKNEGRIIGTSRISRPSTTDLSYYHDLYQLHEFHENNICIVTRYMIYKEYRKRDLGYALALATIEYCHKFNIQWIVMDCSPNLYGYFEKLGFDSHLGVVHHPEYGEVKIMKFDVRAQKETPLNNNNLRQKYAVTFQF